MLGIFFSLASYLKSWNSPSCFLLNPALIFPTFHSNWRTPFHIVVFKSTSKNVIWKSYLVPGKNTAGRCEHERRVFIYEVGNLNSFLYKQSILILPASLWKLLGPFVFSKLLFSFMSVDSWYTSLPFNLSNWKVFILFQCLSGIWLSSPYSKWIGICQDNFVAKATSHWQELCSLGLCFGRQLYFSGIARRWRQWPLIVYLLLTTVCNNIKLKSKNVSKKKFIFHCMYNFVYGHKDYVQSGEK